MGSLNPRIRGARGDYCGLPEGPRERFLDSRGGTAASTPEGA